MKFTYTHKHQRHYVNYVNCISFGVLIITEQIPVASRSEERVFGRWLDGIVGSNLAGWKVFCLLRVLRVVR